MTSGTWMICWRNLGVAEGSWAAPRKALRVGRSLTRGRPHKTTNQQGREGDHRVSMSRIVLFAALVLGVMIAYRELRPSPEFIADASLLQVSAPLELVPDLPPSTDPIQTQLREPLEVWLNDTVVLQPVATYQVAGVVLGTREYRSDALAVASPIDFALGWGPMSNPIVYEKVSVTQRNRWYYWSTREPPIPVREIAASSANVHLIPASESVWQELKRARVGSVVRLDGYLVEVSVGGREVARTSRSRLDRGAGACEIILVVRVSFVD